jgi:hypothetical protein
MLSAAGVAFNQFYLSPQTQDRATRVVNGELTYEFGPSYPEAREITDLPRTTPAKREAAPVSEGDGGGIAPPPSIVPRENEDAPPQEPPSQPVKAEPAQFKDAGFFAGGKADSGVVISGIRFGREASYRRIVIDYGVPDASNPNKLVPTSVHPKYKVEYRSCPFRFTVTFEGVKYSDNATVQKKYALPFGLVTDAKGMVRQLEFFVTKPAMFKVIECDDPARLAIDVMYREDAEIPTVQVVQVIGIDSVAAAFNLIETGAFPESFQPQVIAIGEQFFVEGIYDTLEAAAKVSGELENMGYSTIISERKGNAFPAES